VRLASLPNKVLRPLGVELRRFGPPEPVPRYPITRHYALRLLYFQHLVELIEDVPGDIVECGVGTGYTLFTFGVLTADGKHPRRLWGFDSFQGLPEAGPEDKPHRSPSKIITGRFASPKPRVRARMIRCGIPEQELDERFVLVEGLFPATFPEYSGGPIALLHLDVDLYQSYKDCLEYFVPKVAPGGVIAFDEYRDLTWVGATRAIEEYFGGPPPGIQKSPQGLEKWFMIKG